MLKSDVLKKAAIAVMEADWLGDSEKLEIVRVLFDDINVALYVEKEKLKKQEKENG